MGLHLNLLHEEIQQQRDRQRDPLKIGMMVLAGLGAIMLLYYLWNAYQVLGIRSRLTQTQHDWAKVEPKVTGAQKRSAELNSIISTTKKPKRFIGFRLQTGCENQTPKKRSWM